MTYAPWKSLLESLSSWADAREVTGGIEVTFRRPTGGRRTVELVMTRAEWDSLAGTIGRDTPRSVRERILDLPEDRPFLVCDRGVDLFASATRQLPRDPLLDLQPEPGGRWIAEPTPRRWPRGSGVSRRQQQRRELGP